MDDEKLETLDKWEYFVLQLNYENKPVEPNISPEIASQKLQGSLSADFIKEQFPDQYQEDQKPVVHPIKQLQDILNNVGEQGWELIEVTSLGQLCIYIFKKKKKLA